MTQVLLSLQEPTPQGRPDRIALWDLGFRPFYLVAAAFACCSVPLWALQWTGLLTAPLFRGAVWHAHEMIFGYTLAVVIGFLFTAGRNWSGQPTPTGGWLAGLVILWLAARVLVLTPWGLASTVVNVSVPLLAAWGLWKALYAGGNRRNYFFVALLLVLATGTAVVHLVQLGVLKLPITVGILVAMDVILFMACVMGGRVIPMFSNHGVPGMQALRKPHVEKLALGSVLAVLLADLSGVQGAWLAWGLTLASATHLWRLSLWQPLRSVTNPLVWVLHVAYLWVPVHLMLRAMEEMGWIAPGLGIHAFTVGVIGTMTLGMMTRTALGHTGRALRATRVDASAYLLMTLAALVRVCVPLIDAASTWWAIQVSAALWTLAFVLYLVRYAPFLVLPRADGQPG